MARTSDIRHIAVEANRHGRSDCRAIRPLAIANGVDDLLVGPFANAGIIVRRYIWRDGVEHWQIDHETAGEFLIREGVPVRSLRCMAVATGNDAVDQIGAALQLAIVRPNSSNRKSHHQRNHGQRPARPISSSSPYSPPQSMSGRYISDRAVATSRSAKRHGQRTESTRSTDRFAAIRRNLGRWRCGHDQQFSRSSAMGVSSL